MSHTTEEHFSIELHNSGARALLEDILRAYKGEYALNLPKGSCVESQLAYLNEEGLVAPRPMGSAHFHFSPTERALALFTSHFPNGVDSEPRNADVAVFLLAGEIAPAIHWSWDTL